MSGEELELLDIDAVRAILGVSRTTVYALEEKGFLQRVNGLGFKGVRFRRSDIEDLVRRRIEATPDQFGMRHTTVIGGASDRGGVVRDLQEQARRDDELVRTLAEGRSHD